MTGQALDPMRDDGFDREIRRFLEWETSQIDGAPSRAEMVDRLARTAGLTGAQHPAFGSTRAMRVVLAVALLAALLVGVLAVGSDLARRNPVVLGPTPGPTPGNLLETEVGAVPAGTYLALGSTSTPFTLTMGAGWRREPVGHVHVGDPWSANGVAFNTWLVTYVYGDACHTDGTRRETGSRELLATALMEQKGHAPFQRTEVTFGGLPATQLEISIPSDYTGAGCDDPDLQVLPNPGGADSEALWVFGGEIVTIYIVDAELQPTVFATIRKVDSFPANVAALEGVVASVRFQP
jgi:hypothetical protein